MSNSPKNETGIAIVGMAGRFPKARNLDEFWRNLCEGVEAISFFSDDELTDAGVTGPHGNSNCVKARAVLEGADLFDAAFFGMNPKEAELTDPQHRLFLECAWEALENANCDPQKFAGPIGVFAGMSTNTYLAHNLAVSPALTIGSNGEFPAMIGNERDYLTSRVSYKLNLRGPSLNIQTACSTSLVAVSVACQHLLTYQCDVALAGAVSVSFPQKRSYVYQEGGITSPDGHCRPFDANSAGTVSGDGVGVIALKRLEDALKDNDAIYAVIKGFATNNDGSLKIGYTAPSVEGQAEVVAMAQAMADFAPETISYIEAHGTGTPLGDPIEIEALTKAFCLGTSATNFCAIGSVKSNLGHLDTAAGMAGLIKTALMLHHKKIPPSLHFKSPNPKINFAESPFHVNTTLAEWKNGNAPRRAGVSSFGIGGTNAHIALEEAPAHESSGETRPAQLLLLSAKTKTALDAAAKNLGQHLKEHPDVNLADAAYTLQTGRRAFGYRAMLVCRDIDDAVKALASCDAKRISTGAPQKENPPIVFMFPGQGAQHINMGRQLYETEPAFRETVDYCCKSLEPHLGFDLRTVLYPSAEKSDAAKQQLNQTAVTQPAMFVIEYALAKLWMSWGVQPAAMIGHSLGEYVAACLAGVFSLDDALALIAARGRMMQALPSGTMLAVRLPESEIKSLLSENLSLAAVNASTACVVSGTTDDIESFQRQLAARNIGCIALHTSHAFHSAMMEPIITPFAELVKTFKCQPPQIPFISNVTGTWITNNQATDPHYWATHLRQAVRFADGLGELFKAERIFLEVGPGQTLSGLARQHSARKPNMPVISSFARAKDESSEPEAVLDALGQLWLNGASPAWDKFYAHENRRGVWLPTYPFERKRYWAEPVRTKPVWPAELLASAAPVKHNDAGTESIHDSTFAGAAEDLRAPACESETRSRLRALVGSLSGLDAAALDIKATFTQLGFDSLFLTQASVAIERDFGVHVAFRQLLEEFPTLDSLAEHIDKNLPLQTAPSLLGNGNGHARFDAKELDPITLAPLTESQREIWFAAQMGEAASCVYNECRLLHLRGSLQADALHGALQKLVARHEALRTTFAPGGDFQRIHPTLKVEIPFADWSHPETAERALRLDAAQIEEARQPFDLVAGPLLRARLIRLAGEHHVFVVTIHHLVCDGYSFGILLRELGELYSAECRGAQSSLPSPLQFSKYAKQQAEQEQGPAHVADEKYWLAQFAVNAPTLELPTDHPRTAVWRFDGAREWRTLPSTLGEKLKRLSAEQGCTLFTTIFAAYGLLLRRLSGQKEVVIGVPLADRAIAGGETLVGHCVNFLPLRGTIEDDRTFAAHLSAMQKTFLDADEHGCYAFGTLLQKLNLVRDPGRMPLVSATFNLERVAEELKFFGVETELASNAHSAASFDISFDVTDAREGLELTARYNASLFSAQTIQRWLGHFQTLLEAVTANPQQRVCDLPLLTGAERRKILVDWNLTSTDYPRNKCVHQVFEEQAAKTPNAVAVEFERAQLTYRELNERSNRLANYLQKRGVGADTVVAMCLDRSLEMIVAVLAILKAGGAYMPLDPSHPKERLALMLQQARVPVVLTQEKLRLFLPESDGAAKVIYLDSAEREIAQEPLTNPASKVTAESLAYISFTSGSTGQPKGVCVPHRAVVRLVKDTNYVSLTANEVFLQLAPLAFDASTFEIWGALLNGARLVVFPPHAPSLAELGEFIQQHRVTTLWLTAGLFHQMIEEQVNSLRGVRQLLAGGDVLSVPHVKRALEELPDCRLINGYGPTENTTFTCCYPITNASVKLRSIPIGRPVANTQVYALDENLQPVPISVPGELYAGGDGLARGYLNQPELTAEKFIPDPFSSTPGARLYKTGDLVRWLADGTLEFLGRMDAQVKIRGNRVELGEIETVLSRHPAVRECAVVARQDSSGDKRLTAYFVSGNSAQPTADELRGHLQRALPEYMIPSAFVRLDSLPLTATGKVDRKSLASSAGQQTEPHKPFVAVTDDFEKRLAEIWQDVLSRSRVGANDDFFELGGHSLLALRLIARVETVFGKKIPVASVFHARTVAQMTNLLREKTQPPRATSLVEIQPRGSQPPLMLVHGAGGGMFWGYTSLSQHLGEDQPVYAFKSRGVDGGEEFASIEEMAQHYVADLRAFQPRGPYYLGGYCFGGNVAYEMARQLRAQGEKVALLALINCMPPNSSYDRIHFSAAFCAKFLKNLIYWSNYVLHLKSGHRREFLRWKLRAIKTKLLNMMRISGTAPLDFDIEDFVDLTAQPEGRRSLWEAHVHALFKHQPKPYAGPVTLFRTPGHSLLCSFDETFGWQNLAANGVTVRIVSGAHETIMDEPHVNILAEELKRSLDEAQQHKQETPATEWQTKDWTPRDEPRLGADFRTRRIADFQIAGESSVERPAGLEACATLAPKQCVASMHDSEAVETLDEPTAPENGESVDHDTLEHDSTLPPADQSATSNEVPPSSTASRLSPEEHIQYWKNQLADAPAVLEFPTDHPRPAVQSHRMARQPFSLDKSLTDALAALAREENCTMFITLLSAFQALAWRYTACNDIVIGSQIFDSKNTLPLRADLSGDPTFRKLLGRVREIVLEAQAHQDLSSEQLIEALAPIRDHSYHPVFQVLLALQSNGQATDLSGCHSIVGNEKATFDLVIDLRESASGIDGWFDYAADLFEAGTIERMVGHWKMLIKGIAADPNRRLSELPLLTAAEARQLASWNETANDYPRTATLSELFEAQVARTPDVIALTTEQESLTYRELNSRANRVAHYLRSLGVQPDTLVGICPERGAQMVVGILGILKAGGAYVPLDPAYPKDRLAFIMDDARAPVLLTQELLLPLFSDVGARGANPSSNGTKVVCLDSDWEKIASASDENPAPLAQAHNLSHVIYTSGSTGKPKGVAIEHHSPVALVHWAKEVFNAEELAGVLASTSICFDLSVFELFVPLCLGGRVVLAENALQLPSLRAAKEVTLINTVPSAMKELLRLKGVPESIRVINLAGEPLTTTLVERIYQEAAARKVYDLYGPTETTVYSTFALRKAGERATIGRPLANEKIHLLDARQQLVPIGVPGEIYIGGDGVARGYLNRPELTAEKFVPNPFNNGDSSGRLYRTGDLARYRPDGNIEFLGRSDHQVKIRGFRIELGEIEMALRQHSSLQEVVVMAREDEPGEKRLAAYFVSKPGKNVTTDELRLFLKSRVPEYMIPSVFVPLDEMPLTPNGKVDRKRLPAPDQSRPELTSEYVAPRNQTEKIIEEIWCEVLGLKQIGTQDNFFDLGGNSLLAIQVISRLRQAFQIEVPVAGLFESPTIASLAEGIATERWKRETVLTTISPGPRPERLPLSYSQQRLWFIQQLEPGSFAYNVPAAIALDGKLDARTLEQCLNALVGRHEILRTVFRGNEGEPAQVILPNLTLSLRTTDLRGEANRDSRVKQLVAQEAQRPFDLARGPLIRCSLLRLAEQQNVLVVVMHHIISDGWSLGIFFQELAQLYDAKTGGASATLSEISAKQSAADILSAGRSDIAAVFSADCKSAALLQRSLSPLKIQYADYAIWQHDKSQEDIFAKHGAYWKTILTNAPSSLELPTDRPPASEPDSHGSHYSNALPGELVAALKQLNRRESTTPFMTLLTALMVLLNKWTRESDIVVGSVSAGRTRPELENLIGCFMNFLPIRLMMDENETGLEILRRAKATVLESQNHQDCPFEKIVEATRPERRTAQNPIYNVGFLLQNFPQIVFATQQVTGKFVSVETDSALLDLRFVADETDAGYSLTCEYRTGLFERKTIEQLLNSYCRILETLVQKPEAKLSEFAITRELEDQSQKSRTVPDAIAITATFTAEPLAEPLEFWMRELDLPAKIEFAPYNQTFQQLLDPTSLLAGNARGQNVVLVRMEDWVRGPDGSKQSGADAEKKIERTAGDLVSALRFAAERGTTPFLVCICPSSKVFARDSHEAAFFERMHQMMTTGLGLFANIHLILPEQLAETYPVEEFYDPRGDELGHVPYTPAFFAALATLIARKFNSRKRPSPKVIVLDCDQTLWTGVCGEDGPDGIELDAPRRALQEFMRAQLDAGRLLCLCSKNNPEDVQAVFEQRNEMPLKLEHFAATRINWQPKSQNLKALAEELNLGVESFVLVDDNPVECAEVQANCPGAQALQLPESPELIPQFLKHCWIFDDQAVTTEDRQRTDFYRQERQRAKAHSDSLSLQDFLATLDLKIQIAELSINDLVRAAQLTQRTNQFNCTTRRRTETEIRELLKQCQALTVSVSDRFGDYGLVGLVISKIEHASLSVETFLLSCRALGRGVEHKMLAHLGIVAKDLGAAYVDVHFIPSAKNKPALDFLESVGSQFRQALNGGYVFRFPAEVAATTTFTPQHAAADSQALTSTNQGAVQPDTRPTFARWRWIALEANDADKIQALIEAKAGVRKNSRIATAAPGTDVERELCGIWQELLRIESVGIRDNFFELGGHSLLAVRLFAQIEKRLRIKLPIVTIFQSPTVEQLARAIEQQASQPPDSGLLPIQPEGGRPPLFLVHGAGGDVLWGYANLAHHTDRDQPIYGIQACGVEEFSTLEEMAAHYVEKVRAFQPDGPYYLGGYCFGGNVAQEMARQLEAQGESVALLALLDCAPSNCGYERPNWRRPSLAFDFTRNLFYWMEDFTHLKREERRSLVRRKLQTVPRKVWKLILGRQSRADFDLEEFIDVTHVSERETRLWNNHLGLLVRHTSKPYGGHISLFRTRGHPLVCSFENDFGWGKIAGGVTVKRIPGSHEGIFMEPHVRILARELEQSIHAASQPIHQETPASNLV